MPELYTFVTERTFDMSAVEEIVTALTAEKIEFKVHRVDSFSGKASYFISGCNWEEDCGYPPELTMIFEGSGITCVYCNNNEYGIVPGEVGQLIFNSSSSSVNHYKGVN